MNFPLSCHRTTKMWNEEHLKGAVERSSAQGGAVPDGTCNGSSLATVTVSPIPDNMSTNSISARERTRAKQVAEVSLVHSRIDAYPVAKNSMPPT